MMAGLDPRRCHRRRSVPGRLFPGEQSGVTRVAAGAVLMRTPCPDRRTDACTSARRRDCQPWWTSLVYSAWCVGGVIPAHQGGTQGQHRQVGLASGLVTSHCRECLAHAHCSASNSWSKPSAMARSTAPRRVACWPRVLVAIVVGQDSCATVSRTCGSSSGFWPTPPPMTINPGSSIATMEATRRPRSIAWCRTTSSAGCSPLRARASRSVAFSGGGAAARGQESLARRSSASEPRYCSNSVGRGDSDSVQG
jgi:hypothetical protein